MQSKAKAPDRTIGLLIDWIETPYQTSLVTGVLEAAKSQKMSLFIFEGGSIDSPMKREAPRNIIYNFISSSRLDGLIVSAGSLTNFTSQSGFERFLSAYAPLPIVMTSISMAGYPSVVADSRGGLRELLLHLVRAHGRKRIAFVKGPADNPEAYVRFETYRSVLDEVRIPFAGDLVVQGDFTIASGRNAVRVLLDERHVEFDALAASNDDMAIGAIGMLNERGITVPGDIAVTGFDDLETSACIYPALSTVHQPIPELGKKAVNLLAQLIRGEQVRESAMLPSLCVTRESCGCKHSYAKIAYPKDGDAAKKRGKGTTKKNGCSGFVASVMKDFRSAASGDTDESVFELLCKKYFESISRRDGMLFLDELESSLLKEKVGTIAETLEMLLTVMKTHVDDWFLVPGDIVYANRIWSEAMKRVRDLSKRESCFKEVIENQIIQNLLVYRGDLTSATNLDEFVEILANQLDDIGISSCYLSLYEDATPDSRNSLSRIIFGYRDGKRIRIEQGGRLFPSRMLVPDGMVQPDKFFSFHVEPLFFGNTQLGFVLIELSQKKRYRQNLVRRLFMNLAFNGAVYVHQIAKQTLDFEAQVIARTDAITRANELLRKLYNERTAAENTARKLNEELEKRVEERTSEIETANKALKKTLNKLRSTQSQLVQSEKMAALGSLVAGISHEINTPIGISVTAASFMEKKTNDLYTLYRENKLKRTDLDEYLSMVLQASGMVLSNLQKSYEMIHEFKNIAVDQEHEEKKTFEVKKYIDEIAHAMESELVPRGHRLEVKCEDRITFTSYPGAVNRILMLLLSNSLIHGFKEDVTGTISLRVKKKGRNLVLHFSDNGIGMDKQNVKKVFAPFFTTKRSDGKLGLGLHIVFNLVTRTLGGRIRCMSELGKGTAFFIKIADVEQSGIDVLSME